MPDIKYPEFTAATLPLPQQWEGKGLVWRDDLKVFQYSDGTAWQQVSPVSGDGNFDATDAGSGWAAAPASLGVQATLTAGTSTTVLVETKDASDVVSTAATIVADTLSEVLRQTVFLTNAKQYRLRRSSGTGTVNLLIQR